MKSKKMTYLLLVLSIVIWGTAGWKVYQAFHSETDVPTITTQTKIVEKDSVALLLNYRDPFLGNYVIVATAKDTSAAIKRHKPNSISPKETKKENAPDIQFKGVMKMEKNSLIILQTRSGIVTLKTGEEVDGYRITKLGNNKVVLTKGGKKYEISSQ